MLHQRVEDLDVVVEAVGGAAPIRAIETMVVTGGTGSALLTSAEDITLYLAKPDRFKQQGLFSIVLADGERLLYNNGVEQTEITGVNAEELGYRLGFYHNAFSLRIRDRLVRYHDLLMA